MQAYESRVLERLRELYPDGGPDVLEFPDFLGEGFVIQQAAETLDPLLANTCICVRLHTTAEMCEILDGFSKPDFGSRSLHAMERYSLARADRVIWQGGDILSTYQRFYGRAALGPAVHIRYPYRGDEAAVEEDETHSLDGPLRVLYAGRLERRKGVHNLVSAATGLDRDDFHLTLVGSDTPTGPLGVSLRAQLELEIAEDPRIRLADALERSALAAAIQDHDVVAVPSLWECWPYAALEPLHLNRPLLGTPVGGLTEMITPGRSGWRAAGTDAVALEDALRTVLDEREQLQRMLQGGEPLQHGRSLVDEQGILDAYERLATIKPRARHRPLAAPAPLVSAIVPYYRASRFVRATIESLLMQTYPRLEILLVNDGSFEEEDWIVAELAAQYPVVVVTQMNQGLGAARNFGIQQSRGRYVFPLDADNVVDPSFVERCVAVLEAKPEIAYVTSWSRYIDEWGEPLGRPGAPGYQPLGNHAAVNSDDNVSGDAAAVLRRRLFDAGFAYSRELTSYEDWHLYRELQRAGHFGAVIPDRLLGYRVREDSMQAVVAQPRRERLLGEINALIRENEMQWTSSNA
jgi:glycosyltransferase involved in cell wall biosynthesis